VRAPLGAAVALVLLLPPGLALRPGDVSLSWALAPDVATPDAPLAALVEARGPPGTALEVKAWLAQDGSMASRTWDGAAWERSDRYHLRWLLDEEGHARGQVSVRPAGLAPGTATLAVRARAGGEALATLERPLEVRALASERGLAPGAAMMAALEDGRLRALAPVGLDAAGAFILPPVGEGRAALDAEGRALDAPARGPPALALQAVLVAPVGGLAEGITLRNTGQGAAALDGWALRVGATEHALRGTLPAGAAFTLARNASAHRALSGQAVQQESPGLRLPDAEGSVVLAWLGEARDAVAWGRAGPAPWEGPPLPAPRPGDVLVRAGGGGHGAASWVERRAGVSAFAPLAAEAEVVPFTRAEALGVALRALAEARLEVRLEVYTLTSPELAAGLHDALARGVRVRVLVEGAPVAGMPDAERARLDGLAAAGADVRTIGGRGQDRYASVHAKFAVLDGEAVLLGSENWTPSGFAADGRGNVGWGVLARSPALATRLAQVWDDDADPLRADVRVWAGRGAEALLPPGALPPLPPAAPANATLLLAPDGALGPMLGLLRNASSSLDLEELQMPLAWEDGPSPFVEALRRAAERGVRVRALLDGQPGGDNAPTAAALGDEARERGWPLEARLARGARVHNKAVVADGRQVLLGSVNLGSASVLRNREAALLLDGAAAERFGAAFEADWSAAAEPPPAPRASPVWLAAPLAAAAALAVWRGRR
jgi:phosphatidylserine/phosphatidylglycerophosphate/cardiolipin synthase-like enzyme